MDFKCFSQTYVQLFYYRSTAVNKTSLIVNMCLHELFQQKYTYSYFYLFWTKYFYLGPFTYTKKSLAIIPVASWILSKASLYDYTRPYYSTWSIHWHNAYLNCCFSLIHLLRFFLCFHFFNVLMCFSALLIFLDMNSFSLWSWSITSIIPKNRYQFTVHIL